MSSISVKVEFGGGLELLFSNQRSHRIEIPSHVPAQPSSTTDAAKSETESSGRPADITYLMYWLRDNLLKEREELFIENGTVYVIHSSQSEPVLISCSARRRPGILVLVNDTDWELEGEGDYVLQEGDEIVFISTLHGG